MLSCLTKAGIFQKLSKTKSASTIVEADRNSREMNDMYDIRIYCMYMRSTPLLENLPIVLSSFYIFNIFPGFASSHFSEELHAIPRNMSTNRQSGIVLAVFKSFWQIQKVLMLDGSEYNSV